MSNISLYWLQSDASHGVGIFLRYMFMMVTVLHTLYKVWLLTATCYSNKSLVYYISLFMKSFILKFLSETMFYLTGWRAVGRLSLMRCFNLSRPGTLWPHETMRLCWFSLTDAYLIWSSHFIYFSWLSCVERSEDQCFTEGHPAAHSCCFMVLVSQLPFNPAGH